MLFEGKYNENREEEVEKQNIPVKKNSFFSRNERLTENHWDLINCIMYCCQQKNY